MSHASSEFIPAHIAILTVSDSRGAAEDTSGQYLQDAAQEAGHQVVIAPSSKMTFTRSARGFPRGLPMTTCRRC